MWHCSAKLKNLSVALVSRAKNLIQLQPRVISNDFHWLFGSQSKHRDFVVYPPKKPHMEVARCLKTILLTIPKSPYQIIAKFRYSFGTRLSLF